MTPRLTSLPLALSVLLLASPLARAEPVAPKPLIIATGEIAGFYFPVGGAVCRILGRDAEQHGLRCLVEPTSGTGANLALLSRGEADLAILQSRALQQAQAGQGAFAGQAFPGLRAIAALHGEPLLVVVAKAAKIRSLADLKGKKVNLGRPQSFQRMMAESALAAAGLGAADLGATLEIDVDQQAAALCDGRLEVGFFTGIHPMPTAQQALQECEVDVLDLKAEAVRQIVGRQPFLAAQVLPADTYPGIEKEVTTFAMKAVLAATDKLADGTAEQVAKALAGGFSAFVQLHPVLRGATRDGLPKDGITVPLHAGAEKHYREAGLVK